MGGTLSAATRTVPNSKRAITSPHKWRRGPNLIFENRPARNSKAVLEMAVFRAWAAAACKQRHAGRAPRLWSAALASDWQKCHIDSVSDSRLLREARMLHYGTTSRSARIVVTLLHESPGPTTAGASLFWTPDSPPVRVDRSRPWPSDYRNGRRVSVRHRLRSGQCKTRVISAPAEALRCSPVRILSAVKSQRRRQTLLGRTRLDAAWEIER